MIDGVASWYSIYWEHAEDSEGSVIYGGHIAGTPISKTSDICAFSDLNF